MSDPSAPPDSAGQLQPGGGHEAAPPAHEAAPPAHATTAAVHSTTLPPFWTRNPRTWFTQVEARFRLHRITSQETKYNSVVTSLPGSIADELADILDAPHPEAPYDHLKAAIIQRKSESERSRLQQLLNTEELGDRRPSQLLHRMRQLLGDHGQDLNNPLLRELFLQRLPQNMVLVLAAAADMPLDQLAELADRVADYSRSPSIAAVVDTPTTSRDDSRLGRLESRIDELSHQLSSLAPLLHRRRRASRDRRYSPSPSRSQHRSSATRGEPGPSGVCWYHRTFGTAARKCSQPCSWTGN